jgi:GGDEF domain-containing protein
VGPRPVPSPDHRTTGSTRLVRSNSTGTVRQLGIVLADPHTGPDTDRNLDALLAAADQAMYQHKTSSRTSGGRTAPEPSDAA